MNQSKKGTSLSTTRLSPLAKPFTFNPSPSTLEIMEPTYSPNVTGLVYGKKGVDFHESLFGKGNDGGGSVDDGSMLQQGKHGVDGIFNKSTDTIGGGKDIVSNCIGTIHTADESSSFLMSNNKLVPLKLSTTDMSSAKNIPQIQTSQNSGDSDSDVDSPCWKGTMAICPTPSKTSGSEKIHHVKKATEKHNSLNPKAPQFFPGIGFVKDDFLSDSLFRVAPSLVLARVMILTLWSSSSFSK